MHGSLVFSYNQLQIYLRHCTLFWLYLPAYDLVLVTLLLPLSKLQYSGIPPYGHLGNTFTSLFNGHFFSARQNGHTFS